MIDTAGAQRVLTLITTDMDARQRLLAHYRGDEDPVSALREVVDPAHPSADTIARLERAARLHSVAYGPTDTSDSREAAAAAQHELARDRAHAGEIRDAVEAAVTAFLAEQDARDAGVPLSSRREHATEAEPRRGRRISVGWLIPVAVVALAVGVVIGGLSPALVGSKAGPGPTPVPHSTSTCAATAQPTGAAPRMMRVAAAVAAWEGAAIIQGRIVPAL